MHCDMAEQTDLDLLHLTAGVVSAFVSNNNVGPKDLPQLIAAVHAALGSAGTLAAPAEAEGPEKATAAQIRRSIRRDALISFEDGKPYKSLRRHLTSRGLTMDEYRAKWGLLSNYPTVSPAYSQARSELAKAAGLGQKGRITKSAAASQPAKRGRPKKISS